MTNTALASKPQVLHAKNAAGDRMLCGVSWDVGFTPQEAKAGQCVTCPDCKQIIALCQDVFTQNYRVRRK